MKILQLLVAGACPMVKVLTANLKVAIVNQNIKRLQMFDERSIIGIESFSEENVDDSYIYIHKLRERKVKTLTRN